MAKRRVHSIQDELIRRAKEAALNAVQTFNNPLTQFRSESFIVLMVIAWTYLIHAYYRREGVDYRYFDQGPVRRKFHRTKGGAIKHWELERCLNCTSCPLDRGTQDNLRFLIGLRHEIEHQMSMGLDVYLGSRYLACSLNFEHWLTSLFGQKESLAASLSLTLQFTELTAAPISKEATGSIPQRLVRYIENFDDGLSDEEFDSPRFAYRLLFVQKLTGKRGQADRVVEFIPPDSPLADEIGKDHWVQKEGERPKHLPKNIVKKMQNEGFVRFTMHQHTQLWKDMNAKNPGKGYGIFVEGYWYWYERWVDEVRRHCQANPDRYRAA